MEEHQERVAAVINTLARRYGRFLPDNALNSTDDLRQEGWVVYSKLMKKRYKPELGEFETWLWTSVTQRFKTILKKERRPARMSTAYDSEFAETVCDRSGDPERFAMTVQALNVVAKHSVSLAQAVIDGWPKEVVTEARRQNRIRQRSRGGKAINGSIIVTKSIIKDFFDVDLTKLRAEENNVL